MTKDTGKAHEVVVQTNDIAQITTSLNEILQRLTRTEDEVRAMREDRPVPPEEHHPAQEVEYVEPHRQDRLNIGGNNRMAPRRNPRFDEPRQAAQDRDIFSKPKVTIPPFKGKYDPDGYCDWESKVDLIFSYYPCPEGEQVQMIVFEFSDYALVWWTQLTKTRNNNGEGRVRSWEELKHIMRRRFIPPHYQRELKQRLQRLRQGSRTVEEYYKEMEALIQRADIREDEDDTLARFIVGLNDNILDVLDLQNYVDLPEALQIAIAIENQQR